MKKITVFLRVLHLLLALLVASGLIYVTAFGIGPLPALGPALSPGTGIWSTALTAHPLQSQVLRLQGLKQAVSVTFEKNGTPHIQAANDDDLFWTIGYLQARFRLAQMDLLRRQGEGRLSEILGSGELNTDRFQLALGLKRAAEAEWRTIPANSATHQVLIDYANGVNALIAQDEQNNSLSLMFKLLNYRPGAWTAIDTLVVEKLLAQQLSFSTRPLDYATLVRAFGYERTMQWFPVVAPDVQHPYDTASSTAPNNAATSPEPLPSQLTFDNGTMQNIAASGKQIAALPDIMLGNSASNNWAVNGPKTASGKALMAGDPHLNLTLPSIWFQMEGIAPGYHFSGAAVPGVPLVLVGYNQHISWSMTDTQNQSTLFYVEKTDQGHPGQYFWHGAWQPMQQIAYDIPVKGAGVDHYEVNLTVHGPVVPADQGIAGETITVDWMGALPTTNIAAQLKILQASNFEQFKQALSTWGAPTLNFVYADDQGNIGMISPGYYPLTRAGAPWLPLPGTGEADVQGTIPYQALPQVYNPPDHMVFSANQRLASNTYPYYIGTTLDGFDSGYRANEIYDELSKGQHLDVQDMERIQNSTHDYLAGLIVPELLNALQQSELNAGEQQALTELQTWNGDMNATSSAAAIWWTFWSRYLIDTFEPWWQASHLSTDQISIAPATASLNEDLETWTLNDPHNAAFTLPDGTVRDANAVMSQAFKESISELSKELGVDPARWQWGKLHTRKISSNQGPGYGPYPGGGDSWTINAASSGALSESNPTQYSSRHGPSWRMIVDWSSGQPRAEEAYPGGVDENPASPWYENQITAWQNGHYYPMLDGAQARQQAGNITWTLEG